MENKELTYSKAAAELETIVKEIENEQISVDVLSEKVKQAAQLIQFCRGKLRGPRMRWKKFWRIWRINQSRQMMNLFS